MIKGSSCLAVTCSSKVVIIRKSSDKKHWLNIEQWPKQIFNPTDQHQEMYTVYYHYSCSSKVVIIRIGFNKNLTLTRDWQLFNNKYLVHLINNAMVPRNAYWILSLLMLIKKGDYQNRFRQKLKLYCTCTIVNRPIKNIHQQAMM